MILFYLLISAMPFMQHPVFDASIGGLTVTKLLGVGCLGYSIYHGNRTGRIPQFFATTQAKFFCGLVVVALTSFMILGHTSRVQISPFAMYVSLLLQFFFAQMIVDTTPKLRRCIMAALIALAIASLYMIREWQQFHNLYRSFRPGAVVGDSNYFGISVVAALPVSYFLLQLRTSWLYRAFVLVCMLLTLIALMLGASRGGFLGLTLAALFIVARSPQPLKKLVAIVAICLPISLAVPQSPVRRLMNPTYSDDDAVQARRVAWKAGQRMIQTHPIVGVGLGNFRDLSASYEDPDEIVISIAHNTYIELAAELGIPGLLLFLGVEVASFISLEKSRKMARRLGDQFLQNVATGLQAGLLGNALALCFVSGQVQKLYWLVIFLGTCLPALLARAKVKKQMMDLKTVKGGAVLLERQAVKGLA